MKKIKYYTSKLKEKSLSEIFNRGYTEAKNRISIERRAIKRKIKPVKLTGIRFYKYKTNSKFFLDKLDFENLKNYYEKIDVNEKDNIINEADKICKHIFPLLGNCEKELGEKIKWNKDYLSGYEWDNKFYKKIELVNYFNRADVKWPWELSRFQHFFPLGKAYVISKDEKYALEFKKEIESWIEQNPIEMSVNWTGPMDVAIRAVNWIMAYYFFYESQLIDDKFWSVFNECLYEHGIFIMENLENKKHTTNHYLSNLLGLIWLGIYFSNYENKNDSLQWLKYGLVEIEKEILIQINDDGTDYETSTSYHRLVVEILFYLYLYCKKNSIRLSEKFSLTLDKMTDFLFDIIKDSGSSPIIGDADDGRILIPGSYYNWNRNDFNYLVDMIRVCNGSDIVKNINSKENIWVTGICNNYKIRDIEHKKSKAYEDGGIYILRNSKVNCIVRCGKLSCNGQGGHSHNDQLSIEFSYNKLDFIVDPGVFVYTSNIDERNLFRSTKMHNTVEVEGLEQNTIRKYDLFSMKEETFAKCLEFSDNKFKGEHFGYKDKLNLIHERKIIIQQEGLCIIDNLKSQKDSQGMANFILDCDVICKIEKEKIFLIKENIIIQLISNAKEAIIVDTFLCKQYGKKQKTKKITLKFSNKLETKLLKL